MTDRKRQPTSTEDFEDPLSNFEPIKYDDAFEQLLCEESVSSVQSTPVATIDARATTREAVQRLSELDIACLLVMKGDELVGIFTERDVLNRVAPDFEAVEGQPIANIMTPQPFSVHETDRVVDALSKIAVGGYRHVPVLDADDKVVGIVSPQRINVFLHAHFQQTGK